MSNSRITPFVKRMRTNGGTIFSFSSAVEDIGLNINERNNVVKISNYALLNIPSIDEPDDIEQNYFNVRAINGAWEYEQDSASIKDGRILIAESFQNYALNLETWLLDQEDYNPTLQTTVSERVFWKWMKETGSTRWTADASNYWTEELDIDGSAGYNTVVKYIGQVSAGNVRQDTFGTYNETYILVPTSHGETRAYFKQVEDENYYSGFSAGDGPEKILGRQDFLQPHPDGLSYDAYYDFVDSSTQTGVYNLEYDPSTGTPLPGWWWSTYNIDPGALYGDNAYLIDPSDYIGTGIYHTDLFYTGGTNNFSFRRSNVDCMSLEFDLDRLKVLYNDPTLTYDKIAIDYATNDAFDFNAVLIYYTVYNSTMDVKLATNLLGVMFLDAPEGNSSNIGVDGIQIPSLEKIMSNGTGFGTSYSLRLNIKTDNMIDDTGALVVDFATSDQLYAEDFSGVFYELEKAVNILTQNNSTINYISEQYVTVSGVQSQQQNQIISLQQQLNGLSSDIAGPLGNIAMFSGLDATDPLIESSIYMDNGNVGINTTTPKFKLEVDGSVKTLDITIENAIRDTGGNVILGYGSPLQLGSSTNYREIAMYTGSSDPAVFIDTSNNVGFANDVSIDGSLYVGGSAITPGGGGSSLWSPGSGSKIYYDSGDVGIGTSTPNYTLDVSGDINFTANLLQNGVPFSPGSSTFEALTDTPSGYGINTQILSTNGSNAITYINQQDLSVGVALKAETIDVPAGTFAGFRRFTFVASPGDDNTLFASPSSLFINPGGSGEIGAGLFVGDVSGNSSSSTTASDSTQLGGVAASGYLRSNATDTASGSLTFSGTNDISGGSWRVRDNIKFGFGTGTAPTVADYEIYHSGSHFYIDDNGVGSGQDIIFSTGGTARFTFDMDNYEGTAVDWIATSDERKKKEFKPYGPVLDGISKINGLLSHFRWKENDHDDVGYSAQEIEKVFPEWVKTDDSEEEFKSISYGKLSAVGLQGIAELREEKDQEIDELRREKDTEISELQREISELRNMVEDLISRQ